MAVQKPGIYRTTLRSNCIYGAEDIAQQLPSDTQVDEVREQYLVLVAWRWE